MEDKGKMDELIEQVKLMNVLLIKQDKREENKESENGTRRKSATIAFFLLLLLLIFKFFYILQPIPKTFHDEEFSETTLGTRNKHSLIHEEKIKTADSVEEVP